MNLKKQFSHNIKKIRKQKGWSQEELAERSGLHRTYISGLERGVRNPTLDIVERIADALDVTPSEVLRDDNDGP